MSQTSHKDKLEGIKSQPPSEHRDDASINEQDSFHKKTLERDADTNEHKRSENLKDWIHLAKKITMAVAVLILIIVSGTWIWHVVTPIQYLEDDQIRTIEKMGMMWAVYMSINVIGKSFYRY